MIRLGLIGPGAWGKNYIDACSGVAEVSVLGRDWRKDPQDWLLALEYHDARTDRFDGIIVATPPEPRTRICRTLAAMNYPMMVEKPVCLSLVEIEAISNRFDPLNPKPFLVNYQHLFSPKYEMIRTQCRGFLPMVSGKARGPLVRSYSQLWDYGPHFLAMAMGFRAKLEEVELDLAVADEKVFELRAEIQRAFSTNRFFYDGRVERSLVLAVRAFAKAVEDGGTDDWRFGVEMSVAITKELERRDAESLSTAG